MFPFGYTFVVQSAMKFIVCCLTVSIVFGHCNFTCHRPMRTMRPMRPMCCSIRWARRWGCYVVKSHAVSLVIFFPGIWAETRAVQFLDRVHIYFCYYPSGHKHGPQ